jgi:hypothetical protein
VGKVCDLCRVLENRYISRTHGYEQPWDPLRLEEQMVTFMMVNCNDEYNLISGISSWRECLWLITGLLLKLGSTFSNKT